LLSNPTASRPPQHLSAGDGHKNRFPEKKCQPWEYFFRLPKRQLGAAFGSRLTRKGRQTAEPLEVGRSTSLLIRIADQEFQATAIIRSCYPGIAMGLEFTFLSNADRSALRSVIARLKEFDTVSG
jgi:hypothetical protein